MLALWFFWCTFPRGGDLFDMFKAHAFFFPKNSFLPSPNALSLSLCDLGCFL